MFCQLSPSPQKSYTQRRPDSLQTHGQRASEPPNSTYSSDFDTFRNRELAGINRASVIFRPSHGVLLVYLTLDPDAVKLTKGFTRDMRGIGHLGTGDLEVRIGSATDLDRAKPLIRRAFEAA